MLSAFARAFRTPDLRNKILFTLGIIALFRAGSFLPAPGVDYTNVLYCADPSRTGSNQLIGMVNLFSGGALLQLSVFALGIMPYITASIIVQLLRVVIPRFEALYQEGQSGTAKLTQYTRYLTIGLAILQSTTIITLVRSGSFFGTACNREILPNDSVPTILLLILTMTAGTGLIMWMGEVMTEKGVGNGMSLLIFTSIAAGFPSSMGQIGRQNGPTTFGLVIFVGLIVLALVIFVEQSHRRVPVQYAKRMVGSRVYGGTSTYIPIKVNQAGVIPVIFASSLLALPQLAASFGNPTDGWVQFLQNQIVDQSSPWHIVLYFLLIIFFAFFYVSITFNPDEIADNMKKYGGFIPGIRAGRPTAEYLQYVLNRLMTPGTLYLGIIALIPVFAFIGLQANQSFPFGGVSILIVVGVGLDTIKQLDAQLQQRHYEGILR